jgi:hypothetical protein
MLNMAGSFFGVVLVDGVVRPAGRGSRRSTVRARRPAPQLEDRDGREHETRADQLNGSEAVTESREREGGSQGRLGAGDDARARGSQSPNTGHEGSGAEHRRGQRHDDNEADSADAAAWSELTVDRRVGAEHDRGTGRD